MWKVYLLGFSVHLLPDNMTYLIDNVAPMMEVYIHLRTAKSKDLASIDKIITLKYCMKHVILGKI